MNEIEKFREGDARPLYDACMANRHFFLLWAYKRFHFYGEDAADLFKDTLILLTKRIAGGKITHTDCCILTILINLGSGLAVDLIRKRDTEYENEEPLAYETEGASVNNAEEQFDHDLFHSCYERYLAILSELDRNILIDKFISDLTTNAIKEKYDLPSTEDVRQRICRAKKAINAKFGEEWRNM